jgi:hypothetical protein
MDMLSLLGVRGSASVSPMPSEAFDAESGPDLGDAIGYHDALRISERFGDHKWEESRSQDSRNAESCETQSPITRSLRFRIDATQR